MKKKKQGNTKVVAIVEGKSCIDLKALIHEHSLFFDKLIDLIPAKFYLSCDDKEKKWFPGLSKDAKALAKEETRENVKTSRRERLDPEKASVSTLDLVMQNLQKEKLKEESDGGEVEINPCFRVEDGDDRVATFEELQERLNRKLRELWGTRGEGKDSAKKIELRKRKREVQKLNKNKKKRKREAEAKKGLDNGEGDKKGKRKRETEEKKGSKSNAAENVEKAAMELKFSHVKIDDKDGGKNKKRKVSKLKELEKAKELAEAKRDPEKGESISWKAAASRAAGIKVHDNPTLLNKSIKKEKKKHQKNVEKWQERVENQQKSKAEKQQKRSQNISDRIQHKKMRKIAKREKKLLDKPRPGFEGRVEGYINEKTT